MQSKEDAINILIKGCDTNKISDGYHTFGELYEHRIELFITLCRVLHQERGTDIYRTEVKNGWFILLTRKKEGYQISYHLPESKLSDCEFAEVIKEGEYQFDGHTSADVLQRLKDL